MLLRAASFALLLGVSALADVKIEDVPDQRDFKFRYKEATDFSGLTWVKGSGYYTVSNRVKALFGMRIELDSNGKIQSAVIGGKLAVKTALDDFEGIAYWPERQRLYVSTEKPPGIVGFDMQGDATFAVNVPKIFAKARRNKGLEALARGPGAFWTGNEDALTVDGNASSAGSGAFVRLQKFNDKAEPIAQFAYRTDTSLVRAQDSGTGLVDLAVLPDGTVLALERVVGLGLVAKIFSIDFEGATDTSKLTSLESAEFTPVKKKLLYERHTGGKNFEGIALGPDLEDGWRSVILIEDSGGGSEHTLIPLRLKVGAEQ